MRRWANIRPMNAWLEFGMKAVTTLLILWVVGAILFLVVGGTYVALR